MTLIQIKNKEAMDLPSLLRLALKRIYDHKNMSLNEEKILQESIVNWKNHLDLKRELGFNAIDEENQINLEYIGNLLYKNEVGDLEKRKEFFKKHNIDYKKFYRLPEAYKATDFHEAQYYLEQSKKENPEDYT